MAGRTAEGRGEGGPGLKGWLLSKGATLGGAAFYLTLVFMLSLGLSAGLVKLRKPIPAPALSQFESYRRLGEFTTGAALSHMPPGLMGP